MTEIQDRWPQDSEQFLSFFLTIMETHNGLDRASLSLGITPLMLIER